VTALPEETSQAAAFPISWSNEQEPRHYWWLIMGEDFPLTQAELDIDRLGSIGGQDAVYFGGYAYTRWKKAVNGRVYMAGARSTNSPGRVRIYGAAWRDLGERMVKQDVTPWEYWSPEVELATSRLASFDAHGVDGAALATTWRTLASSAQSWTSFPFPPNSVCC
jgi:hypothetical protein